MTKPLITCRRPRGGKTVLVRYPYDKTRRRNITDTYGSIRLDADPDDVKAYIKISQKYRHRIIEDLFTVDDLVHIRSWLLENGDPAARARRQARDARVERAVLERLRASAEAEGNPLAQVVTLLPAAGQMLRKLAEDCRARKQEPWELLRKPYMEVYDAIKQFELAAKEAGVTKKRSKSPDAPSA